MPFKQLKKIKLAAGLILTSLLASQSLQADTLQQRQQYDQAMAALKGGQMQRYETLKNQLRDYPLYPYLLLEALQQRGNAVSHQEMQNFFVAHGDLPTAQRLKNDWLRRLARDGEWRQLNENYDTHSQNAGIDCQIAFQRWREGNQVEAMQRAQELWTVGRSQPKDCDPLFDRWRAAGGLTEDVAWARIREALLYRQDALARYLTRYLPSQKALAELFVDTATKPQGLNQFGNFRPGAGKPADKLADIATVSLRRMSRDDPATAMALWPNYRDLPYKEADRLAITRDIGTRMARRHNPAALPFMAANDPAMKDDQISEWRIRLALRSGEYDTARTLTSSMPESMQEQNRWRYWKLRSQQLAQPEVGELVTEYASLAEQRDFYGFLAAERSNKPYALNHTPAHVDPKVFSKVSNTGGIRRAREFFARGQIVDARREWYHVARFFSREEMIAQAVMAKDMEWYFPAIRGISQAQYWDDLDIRFPMAYEDSIRAQAQARRLGSPWVYAITRQESAFMADARSHAGAMGLMQLMPATARETAQRYGINLSNPNDVLIPERNIALGTAYLSQLHNQFQGNRVLASAAYNAGPGRVRQWTRDMQPLPSDIWIETIPFDETRTYVQSVLSYAVIYGNKLGIQQPVMEQHERYLDRR
ncbi:transglycosylase SLT domain-containing protein [Halopseudomonas pelagia]|uniref:Lytic murein transglycosylase n=1 Tax=Halopseudomonas pelagia TaxID=553151 RepID=A0AA91U143_9GAMM|nr:transglycosylase SLT domain-containing protein [Halopseudomonas pelagia]PCC98650.1 lytic murein transglycosylase [Halopseudomonas pelagia]QFY57418.1 lytic murein transglycosylase [Halopseudomonas pelagia]